MLRERIADRLIAWGNGFFDVWVCSVDDSLTDKLSWRLASVFYSLARCLGYDPC